MAFEAKVTGGEKCAACEGTGRDPRYAWIKSRDCPICKGHARYPMTVNIRGYKPPGSITNLPKGWDSTYDHIIGDPPDNRSPMIRALDDSEWRWSLEVFHASEADKWLTKQMRADGIWEPSWLSGRPGSSEMIRLLDDPAWRESLKVAETPRVECFMEGGCPYFNPCLPGYRVCGL